MTNAIVLCYKNGILILRQLPLLSDIYSRMCKCCAFLKIRCIIYLKLDTSKQVEMGHFCIAIQIQVAIQRLNWIWSSLAKEIACPMFRVRPLLEPILASIEPFWITLVTHSDIQIPIRWLLFTKCIPKCHMQTSAILFRFGRALPYYNYNYTSNVFARTIVIFIRNDGCSILFNVLQRRWL